MIPQLFFRQKPSTGLAGQAERVSGYNFTRLINHKDPNNLNSQDFTKFIIILPKVDTFSYGEMRRLIMRSKTNVPGIFVV